MVANPTTGPFRLPVSHRQWYGLFAVGVALGMLIMGLVYEVLTSPLVGPVSIAEAVGLAFVVFWAFFVIGPLSPFATQKEDN